MYTSNHEFYDPALVRAAEEMAGKYEEVDVEHILGYLDDAKDMPTPNYGLLDTVARVKEEQDMYESFITAMQPYVREGWILINTSNHTDASTANLFAGREIKPDIGLYASSREGKPVTQASEAELFGEFKFAEGDEPFRYTPAEKDKVEPIERTALTAHDTRGQLALYINAIQATQQRTRVFSFYIRKERCRLLCHSRAGTMVTPLFDYTKSPYLHQFFWRLSHAPREKRGHDITFPRTKKSDPNFRIARQKLVLQESDILYTVRVEGKTFYVSQPFTNTHIYPVGRGTRCFSAYDPVDRRIVLLKDTWRLMEYEAEHMVYEQLHKHNVRNIPNVVAAGPVAGKFHIAQVGERLQEHYRIVLDVIGKPIHEFTSSHQFITALLSAFQAHWDAWKLAGILHRDISIGNIIIVGNGGMLIDWERSKSNHETKARAAERTGTWQFMSVRVLDNPNTVHEVRDDIESFIHVALWTSARYIPNAMTLAGRSRFLEAFDFRRREPGGPKQDILSAGSESVGRLELTTKPFAKLLRQLMLAMSYLHSRTIWEDLELYGVDIDKAALQSRMLTHTWMEDQLKTALQDKVWKAIEDPAIMHPLAALHEVEEVGKRRKVDVSDYQEVTKKRRVNEDDPADSEEPEVDPSRKMAI